MKTFTILAALAATFSGVSAQAYASAGVNVNVNANAVAVAGGPAPAAVTPPPVAAAPAYGPGCVITSTCPGISTITAQTISTYCPVCDVAKLSNLPYTTTYVTVFLAVCPTGYSSATYTITAVATGTTPCPSIPAGYTTQAVVCSACPGQPVVTVTVPIAAKTSSTYQFTGAATSVQLKGIGSILAAAGASVFFGMIFL